LINSLALLPAYYGYTLTASLVASSFVPGSPPEQDEGQSTPLPPTTRTAPPTIAKLPPKKSVGKQAKQRLKLSNRSMVLLFPPSSSVMLLLFILCLVCLLGTTVFFASGGGGGGNNPSMLESSTGLHIHK